MLYYLFEYLEQQFQFPGASLFGFLTFRAAVAIILSLLISTIFGKRIIRFLQKQQVEGGFSTGYRAVSVGGGLWQLRKTGGICGCGGSTRQNVAKEQGQARSFAFGCRLLLSIIAVLRLGLILRICGGVVCWRHGDRESGV